MNTPRTLTSEEIDDGWCLDAEAPTSNPQPNDEEDYEEYRLEARAPSSGFEEAYWEQVEGRTLTRRFGDVPVTLGMRA